MASRGADDWTGQRLLDHYLLVSFLGAGPIGSVYLGNDARTGRKVAVKIPHLRFLESVASRELFRTSMRRFLSVAHPNLVRALDVGDRDGVPFVVVRFQLGGSLADRLLERSGRLVPLEVMEWLPPIAKALDFLHREGRLHRDVKASNILYDSLGNVTLGEAGLVEALGSPDARLLALGVAQGAAEPLAPEARPAPASDQFALSALVYRALGGEWPIPARTGAADAEVTLPRVPARAAQAVLRALSTEPRDRFQSCSDFARAFERGLQRVSPPSAPAQDSKEFGPVAAPIAAASGWVDAVLVAAVLAAGAGGVLAMGRLPQRPPSTVHMNRSAAIVQQTLTSPTPQHTIDAMAPAPTGALDSTTPALLRRAFDGVRAAVAARAVVVPTASPPTPPKGEAAIDSRARARVLARGGQLASAAKVFRTSLSGLPDRHTIQVTANARDETARRAFEIVAQDFELIVLENPKNKRWYLCVGLYEKQADARRTVSKVPEFFRGQQPSVRSMQEVLRESR